MAEGNVQWRADVACCFRSGSNEIFLYTHVYVHISCALNSKIAAVAT